MHDEKKQSPPEVPIEIYPNQLSSDALNGIIENFILREGTDYGVVEVALDQKKSQILKQISRGDVKIVFDQSTETVSLLTTIDFIKLQKKADSV
ncbi:MAG: YheU family protein [Bdellovibrionaceae bacterium]|nr:YheU family protein [Pseudobdellovibrionaceae bacterium]